MYESFYGSGILSCFCSRCREFDFIDCEYKPIGVNGRLVGPMPKGQKKEVKFEATDVAKKEAVRKKLVKRVKEWVKEAKAGQVVVLYVPRDGPSRPSFMPAATEALKRADRNLLPINGVVVVPAIIAEDVPPYPPVPRAVSSVPSNEPCGITIKVHVPVMEGEEGVGPISSDADFKFPRFAVCEEDGMVQPAPLRGVARAVHEARSHLSCRMELSGQRAHQIEHLKLRHFACRSTHRINFNEAYRIV